jgi:hypothetical protein
MNRPGWRQPLTWVLAGLAALPALVAAAAALTRTWAPVSDWALIELRLRDVGSADTPLLGPFSRYGWNHPGPLMFWLLAPLYRLFGSTPAAMNAAAGVFVAAVTTGLVVAARRYGGRQLAVLVALAACLLLGATGADVADPWNPWLAVVPFALFLVTAAAVAHGDPVMAPVAVGLGSFLVQTHVGYAALVGAIGVWSVAWLAVGMRRRQVEGDPPIDRRRLVIVAVASVAVAVVAWSGPVVEQLTRQPGNLGSAFTYFTTGGATTAGWGEAATVVGRELHPVAPWLGGPEPTNLFTASLERTSPLWAVPMLLALAAATVVARRRRDRGPLHLAGVTWVGLGAGTVAVTRITGDVYFYLVRYWWALALAASVTVVWVAYRWLADRWLSDRWPAGRQATMGHTIVALAIALVAFASLGASVRTAPADLTNPTLVAWDAIDDQVVAALTPGATYRVEPEGFSWFEVLFGLVNRLDAAGIRTVTDPDFVYQFGERRVVGGPGVPAQVAGTLVVATGNAVVDLPAANPRLEFLAGYDPLSSTERARLTGLQAQFDARVRAAGRDDLLPAVTDGGLVYRLEADPGLSARLDIATADAAELTDLIVRGARTAVFLDRSRTSAGGEVSDADRAGR